jgi:hypothetical protein
VNFASALRALLIPFISFSLILLSRLYFAKFTDYETPPREVTEKQSTNFIEVRVLVFVKCRETGIVQLSYGRYYPSVSRDSLFDSGNHTKYFKINCAEVL